jgi:hypothetical protein
MVIGQIITELFTLPPDAIWAIATQPGDDDNDLKCDDKHNRSHYLVEQTKTKKL